MEGLFNGKKHAVIDRIVEGRLAVLLIDEQEWELHVPIERLPDHVTEGTWLQVTLEGKQLLAAAIDRQKTEEAKHRVENKLEELRRNKGSRYKKE